MKVAQTLLQFGPLLACLPCRAGRIRPRLLTRAHRSRQERADQARVSSQEPVGESPRTRDRRRHPHRECCDPDLYRRTGSRSEEHTSELQSLMRISYAVFCLKKKNDTYKQTPYTQNIMNAKQL